MFPVLYIALFHLTFDCAHIKLEGTELMLVSLYFLTNSVFPI